MTNGSVATLWGWGGEVIDDKLPGGSFVAEVNFVVRCDEGLIGGCRIWAFEELARDGAENVSVWQSIRQNFSVVGRREGGVGAYYGSDVVVASKRHQYAGTTVSLWPHNKYHLSFVERWLLIVVRYLWGGYLVQFVLMSVILPVLLHLGTLWINSRQEVGETHVGFEELQFVGRIEVC